MKLSLELTIVCVCAGLTFELTMRGGGLPDVDAAIKGEVERILSTVSVFTCWLMTAQGWT